ncbi:MAG: hypothetical protein ACTS41_01665 [Candidatus Hodgkinia cicadicola]
MFYDFRGFVRKLGRSKGGWEVKREVRFAKGSVLVLWLRREHCAKIDQNGGWVPFDISFILNRTEVKIGCERTLAEGRATEGPLRSRGRTDVRTRRKGVSG